PAVRVAHSAVYDVASNRMIVMGGRSGSVQLNDVWVLSNANGLGGPPSWMQLLPGGTPPPPRGLHAAVYDAATNRMIIFGGGTGTGGSYDDVWVLSNANGLGEAPAWSAAQVAGGPSARGA